MTGTVKYVIDIDGFKYHMKKGLLKKGSTISKTIHPIQEVNDLKRELINRSYIKERGEYYICDKNIPTGVLMAYNLHKGYLVKNLPEKVVLINSRDKEDLEIVEALEFGSFFSADNSFRNRIEKDSFRIVKIMRADYDESFFNSKGIGFSKAEQFVVDVLKEVGAIGTIRRGDAQKHECDIVEERKGRQIEIVSYFDEKIPARIRNKSVLAKEQTLALENCNFGFNVVSEGIIKKFTEKNYSSNYQKELAIYMLCGIAEGGKKIKAIGDELRKRIKSIKNSFAQIHFIIHDPLGSEEVVYCTKERCVTISDRSLNLNPVKKNEVSVLDIKDEKNYFLLKENIFDPNEKNGAWMTGKELKEYKLL